MPDLPLRGRLDRYKTARADQNGNFRIIGVAPGRYKVFAWQNVEPFAWQNAEFLQAFEDGGVDLVVEEGNTYKISPLNVAPSR